jgi:3-hydroxy-9,10-secoandrosta-1,3,5(10)-triene-9,17-dione monooxygenase reductase component
MFIHVYHNPEIDRPRVRVCEIDDLTRFHVLADPSVEPEQVAATMERAGAGTSASKPGHVWVETAWLRRMASHCPSEWHKRFDLLLDGARTKGWVDERLDRILAHIKPSEHADSTRRRQPPFGHDEYRKVLGRYPTGVTVVTGIADDGTPVGLAVGSFTSVSLDPPLVSFMAAKTSTSFVKLRMASSFCVNFLSADQEHICRAFARSSGNKFAGIAWRPAESGAPILEHSAGWVECDFHDTLEVGDHYVVFGAVRALGVGGGEQPLVFWRGGYGRFAELDRQS